MASAAFIFCFVEGPHTRILGKTKHPLALRNESLKLLFSEAIFREPLMKPL